MTDFASLDSYNATPRITSLAVSPDGTRLVTVVSELAPDGKTWMGALWEVDPTGVAPARRLTRSSKADTSPVFTPDGSLLFLSGRPDPAAKPDETKDKTALWRLPVTGEATEVFRPGGGVAQVHVARDAGTVLLSAVAHRGVEFGEADDAKRKAREEAGVTAILHEAYPIRYWDADRAVGYDTQLQADLAGLRPGRQRDAGVRWGREVAQRVVASRADDGSTPAQSQPAGSGPGAFRAEWSGVQYRNVRPFAVINPAVYIPGPPPALDSLDYAAAFAEVALLGDAGIPAPDKLATFQFWSVPAGTGQPAGEWVKIALTVTHGLPLPTSARLMALLTMTLADTTVPTVGTKFNYRHWRPATAIREAETDGNPLTQPNPNWAPRAGSTGGTPEYPSGHSSYSGAAAAVLAGFFCADNIRFTHTTDTAPGGQARTYPSFSAAAAEAGRSRVFGGQHFEFSNQAGLAIGRNVATEVLATRLLKRTGPTHHGNCPL